MASERQAPDTLAAQTNLSGAVAAVQDDPDSPDGSWLTATDVGADTEARVTFPTPTGNPTAGAALQEFRVQVRRTNTGGSNGTPTVAIELYEDGVLVASLASGVGVTSTTGEVVSATWDASSLSTADGSAVECRVFGTNTGGNPSKRRTVEVGAVEWNAEYSAGATVLVMADASHAQTAEAPTLVPGYTLAVGAAAHGQVADAPSLTQAHQLVVADSAHAQAAEAPTLSVSVSLVVADAIHAETADSVALVQAHVLAPAGTQHAQSSEAPTLVQAYQLAVQDALHAHAVGSPSLAGGVVLVVADVSHAVASDAPALTQAHALAVSGALHSQGAEGALTLVQASQLAVQAALHAHAADTLSFPSENAGSGRAAINVVTRRRSIATRII